MERSDKLSRTSTVASHDQRLDFAASAIHSSWLFGKTTLWVYSLANPNAAR